MAVPTFVGAGSGVIIETGSAAVLPDTVSVNTGDLLILQVLQDGIASATPTITPAAGIANLAGTASAMTVIGVDKAVGSNARQHIWVGRKAATGTASVTVATAGDDLYCRMYVFRGVATGTTLSDVIENGFAGQTSNGTGLTAVLADNSVNTLGVDRLALNLVAVDAANAVGPFTGMTGGTWAEATAEFLSTTGTDGCIQLQTAAMATAGTINGGTYTMAGAAGWGALGFALKFGAVPPAGTVVTRNIQLYL